ncbi:hypothetical protein BU16DRAFT_462380 [Lophium mytilinum]|uniref:GDP-mannose transporter n=1 Tax=Lophium mytilinum TaxID=390894 RepID=A0A6A6QR50_9PEZI|nr:hypothetical protein BU16DRAFT_462380 [Lophium mytilinum]
MNRPFTKAGNPFKPAFSYLSKSNSDSHPTSKRSGHRSQTSPPPNDPAADLDSDLENQNQGAMSRHSSHSSSQSFSGLAPGPIPLIDISRSPSPYPRSRSAAQSEDEDDDDFEPASSIRPLVASDIGSGGQGRGGWKSIFRAGGLGGFFFGTWMGWQVYVGLLVFWVGGCGFGLLLMNRFIMLTGVYKFVYPLTATYLQLLITHLLLLGSASLSRGIARPLRKIGLGAAVAPSLPAAPPGGGRFRDSNKSRIPFIQFGRWLSTGTGGIAGGGIFEFDRQIAKQVLPLAVVYVAKVVLSNLSFAYAVLPMYQIARIGVVPLSLIISAFLQREQHSISTLSSSLVATLNLLLASIRPGVRVTWESIVAGVFSSFFVALYPILLLRTYRALVAGLVPQGDILTGYPSTTADESTSNREETRAYWRTLHYTSLTALAILTPLVLLSGEVGNILHNCYILDVPFFWLLVVCGGIGSWAVFASTLLLAKATSPLTATFVAIPRSAFQLVVLSHFNIPIHSWVGVALCWVSSVWFLVARRDEGRTLDRLRLEGR